MLKRLESLQMLCCARYLFIRFSRLSNHFEVTRHARQRFRFNVNNQVAQFDDQKNSVSSLGCSKSSSGLLGDLNSFVGTNCAENEIFRRDELGRV